MKHPLLKLILINILAWSMTGPVFAAEDDLYDFLWLDPDKKVYVLQNKVYKKQGKFYANVGLSYGLNDNFQDTSGVQFAAGYYFHEEWALELLYHQYSTSNSETYDNLQQVNGSIPFIRRAERKYGLMGVYSPFYGKINTFNKIIYFDWSFGLGLGQMETSSNALTVSDSTTADIYADEKNMAILGKTAFRIHATENFHIGLEYHRDHFRAPGPNINNRIGQDAWRNNSEFVISIGFSF